MQIGYAIKQHGKFASNFFFMELLILTTLWGFELWSQAPSPL
jgi:hypothetical protein